MSDASRVSVPGALVPPHVRINKILLFSTVDQNTAAYSDSTTDAYDITESYLEIVFNESIFSLAVTGSISIDDRMGVFEEARVNGQEKLMFSFDQYDVETRTYGTATLNLEFYVTSVSAMNRETNKAQFVLDFASPHIYLDKITRIGRAYGYGDLHASTPGSAQSVEDWKSRFQKIDVVYEDETPVTVDMLKPELFIYHICRNDLRIPADRVHIYGYHNSHDQSERSAFRMKLIVPNMRPFRAVAWLLRNVFSARTSHPWFVYETLISGVRIEPYSVLIKTSFSPDELRTTGRTHQRKKNAFVYNSSFKPEPDSSQYFEDMHRQILGFTSNESTDKFTKMSNGTYSSLEWWMDSSLNLVYPNPSHDAGMFPSEYSDYDQQLEATRRGYISLVDRQTDFIDPTYYPSHPVDVSDSVENLGLHAPSPSLTNYTYYVAFNCMQHGTMSDTFSYHQPFSFKDITAALPVDTRNLHYPGDASQTVPTGASGASVTGRYNSSWSLADTIARYESGGNYNISNKGVDWGYKKELNDFSNMTIGEVRRRQNLPTTHPDKLFATGRYQIIPTTLTGVVSSGVVSSSDMYGPATQDKILVEYLTSSGKRPQIEGFIKTGNNLSGAKLALAQEWASIGTAPGTTLSKGGTSTGVESYYEGDGINRAHLMHTDAEDNLKVTRDRYLAGLESGLSESAAYRAAVLGTVSYTDEEDADAEETPPPIPAEEVPAPIPAPQPASYTLNPTDLGIIGRKGDYIRKNLDYMVHTIKVRGDLTLSPGMQIELNIQRTIDPLLVTNDRMEGLRNTDPHIDTYLSGKYIVIESIHEFNQEGFFTHATVSRDSSTVPLS